MSALVTLLANIVAPLQRQFINFIRIAICVVMVWIGGLKVCQYEADGIAHFVSNSPFLSFLYKNGANEVTNDKGVLVKEYTLYKNPEGKMVAKNIEWHKANGTYTASYTVSYTHLDVYKRQMLFFVLLHHIQHPLAVIESIHSLALLG